MFLPHVGWVMEHGGALNYAQSRFSFTTLQTLRWAIDATAAPLVYLGSSAVVLLIALRLNPSDAWQKIAAWVVLPANAWILPLAFMPFLLTLIFGYVGQAKVSLAYTIPIFYTLPIVAVMALGDVLSERVERVIARCVAAILVVASLGSPAIAYARFALEAETAVEPRMEVANAAIDMWHAEMPGKLKIVTGTTVYAQAVTFYTSRQSLALDRVQLRRLALDHAGARQARGNAHCLHRGRPIMPQARGDVYNPRLETDRVALRQGALRPERLRVRVRLHAHSRAGVGEARGQSGPMYLPSMVTPMVGAAFAGGGSNDIFMTAW